MSKKSWMILLPKSFRDRYRSQWREVNLEAKTIYGKLRRQFVRPPLPKLENGAVNLHLGCGSINHSKFINIDGLPAPHIHYIRAIDDLCFFRDNSVDLIYACHCLEHFPHAKILDVLAEWFRVLKKGATLRLAVPNFDVLLDIYRDSGDDINSIIGLLMGGQYYKFDFHSTIFNKASLFHLLKDTGFTSIQEWLPGSCELTTFDDHSSCQITSGERCYSISLNLQAIK